MADDLLTSKTYRVSAKRANGKFWGFGSMKVGKYDNWQIGIKVTPELKELISSNDGKWVNFSIFEDEKKEQQPTANPAVYDNGSDIPF